jgi:hypothetical protein
VTHMRSECAFTWLNRKSICPSCKVLLPPFFLPLSPEIPFEH